MFVTYDTNTYTIWGSACSENSSKTDALECIYQYEKHNDKLDPKPKLNTIPCSEELFDLVEIDGAWEGTTWVIKNGIATYVDDPLAELRALWENK
jgi:hypothetical protein